MNNNKGRSESATAPTLYGARSLWLEALTGDDRNSILNQIANMGWDCATFSIINESLRLAPQDADGDGVQRNGLIHSFISRNYFANQIIAIRRLVDSPATKEKRRKLKDKKAVYSLVFLLEDMQQHRHLLTRSEMLQAEGVPYDFEELRKRSSPTANGAQTARQPYAQSWEWSEERHQQIDELTGAQPSNRSPDDTVLELALASQISRLNQACHDFVQLANKYVAHAATRESRQLVNSDVIQVTLLSLWCAQRTLCQIAKYTATKLLGTTFPTNIPNISADDLKYADQPLIDAANINILLRHWDKCSKIWHSWE